MSEEKSNCPVFRKDLNNMEEQQSNTVEQSVYKVQPGQAVRRRRARRSNPDNCAYKVEIAGLYYYSFLLPMGAILKRTTVQETVDFRRKLVKNFLTVLCKLILFKGNPIRVTNHTLCHFAPIDGSVQSYPLIVIFLYCNYVTGFPWYTQREDLERILQKFGTLQIERIRKSSAVIGFKEKASANAAVADNNINVYGSFLSAKHYTSDIKKISQKSTNAADKRTFERSKEKGYFSYTHTLYRLP